MPDAMNRTTERELSVVVIEILRERADGAMSIQELIREIPRRIDLTDEDRQPSVTRSGEQLWEQRVRNIRSHQNTAGNFIYEGYLNHRNGGLEITDRGRSSFF